jgi:hypothetical protein
MAHILIGHENKRQLSVNLCAVNAAGGMNEEGMNKNESDLI